MSRLHYSMALSTKKMFYFIPSREVQRASQFYARNQPNMER